MAELTNKLHIKKGGVVHECTCYTTVEEATPITVPGGSAWEIKNNGVVCYVGLWPVSQSGGSFHTPLKVRKNGIDYWADTEVLNKVIVTIVQSENQTIKVIYKGTVYTESFEAMSGDQISVVVEPEVGYTAGAPSFSGGYLTGDVTISATAATKAKYLVTIEQTTGQTITVTCNGVAYTSNFTAEHGDVWTAVLEAEEGYNKGTLTSTGGIITQAIVVSASAAELKKYVISVTQPTNGAITVNGVEGTTFSYNHGTQITVEATADSGYEVIYLFVD